MLIPIRTKIVGVIAQVAVCCALQGCDGRSNYPVVRKQQLPGRYQIVVDKLSIFGHYEVIDVDKETWDSVTVGDQWEGKP